MEDEEFNNSWEDDTTSESESSDSDGENTYVEESFEEDSQHQCGKEAGERVDLNIISR